MTAPVAWLTAVTTSAEAWPLKISRLPAGMVVALRVKASVVTCMPPA